MFGMTKSRAAKADMLSEYGGLDMPEFEAELGEALDASAEDDAPADFVEEETLLDDDEVEPGLMAGMPKQSTATRTNLAALAAFETEMRTATASLDAMDATMAAIGAAHEAAGRFVGNLRAAVLRANDLEEAEATLSAENRRLSERLEQAKHQLSQHESNDEVSRRRIELLVKDYEEAKVTLGKSQIEAVALRDALTDTDAEKTALIYELATRSTAVDRLSRENELLRQKLVSQQMANAELEQRQSDAERRIEEMATIRKGELAEAAELRMRFESTEKECRRLQKLSENSQVRLTEAQERIMTLEADVDELRDRHAAMTERFRSETEVLRAKLESSTRKNMADADEIAVLKLQVGDAVSAASVANAQLASGQMEAWRASRSASPETNVIGFVSYGRERPGKKAKKLPAESAHVTKSASRVAHPRKGA